MPRIRTLVAGLFLGLLGACALRPDAERTADPTRSSLDAYKRQVAHRIVQVNADTYSAPMPQVMKSVVVLEITVDDAGRPTAVSVYRSNGYADLEKRALATVAKAGPFAPPAPALLQGAASMSFLETFLFRDDDFFQVRSLVPNEKLSDGAKLF